MKRVQNLYHFLLLHGKSRDFATQEVLTKHETLFLAHFA